jgi:pantothenate synthetase
VKTLADAGEHTAAKLIAAAREELASEPTVRLDYFEIVDPDRLDPLKDVSHGGLVAVAAYVGVTRLIDNILLPGFNR